MQKAAAELIIEEAQNLSIAVLERITPEGMIFTFRGYRFQRAAQ